MIINLYKLYKKSAACAFLLYLKLTVICSKSFVVRIIRRTYRLMLQNMRYKTFDLTLRKTSYNYDKIMKS